jgi:serine/threonine protein kinase
MASHPSTLGRYQLLDLLGRGSMGVVYKAVDPNINKVVALKTMNQKHISDPLMEERFYREGSILGHLRHRNIIDVYNVGEDDGTCFIAMEYLEGQTLLALMKQQEPLALVRSLDLIRQTMMGLSVAHQQGIIHRDIKPANIFILEGDHVKVLDFGVAHFKNSKLTTSGMVVGTIHYISPEQITGLKVDHRADIFSTGVILYELLAGQNPFIGKNISQTMINIFNYNPPPLSHIPDTLSHLLSKMLEKDRDQRMDSAQEVADRLEDIIKAESFLDTIASESDNLGGEFKNAQQSFIRKMVADRIEAIQSSLDRQNFIEARRALNQLSSLVPDNDLLSKWQQKIRQSEEKEQEKQLFLKQLAQEKLRTAHQLMTERSYVRAIELCQEVLAKAPKQQDARIIKATCIKKLQQFLSQFDD